MKNRKGISLIVLVITIVVMVVLAATVIISLSSNNVVDKANEAVDTTSLKSVQQAATLLWADAYAGGARTQADLEDAVLEGLGTIENLDLDDYTVTVTETGVTVEEIVTVTPTPSERYYGVANIVPTNAEYFEYDYDETTMTATIIDVNETYAEKSYYNETIAYTSGIVDAEGNLITDIVIPYETTDENGDVYTVTGIGELAFGLSLNMEGRYCDKNGVSSYTSFIIPNTVETIDEMAFCQCGNLTSVTIQGNASVGDHAFYGCSGITSVIISGNIGEYAFCRCTGITSVIISGNIGEQAFDGCTGLTSVTLQEGVTSVGGSAFCRCTGITSITIPSSVTSISKNAFNNCTSLTSVTFENTNGWSAGSTSVDVSNATNAATYLTSTYRLQTWSRSDT